MARPTLEIDEKTVETLAKIGATNEEIASHFMCSEATIRGRFCDLLEKSRADRKIKLRELQWRLAEKGNLGMLIWLGKQYLGQSEKHVVSSSVEIKNIKEEFQAAMKKKHGQDK